MLTVTWPGGSHICDGDDLLRYADMASGHRAHVGLSAQQEAMVDHMSEAFYCRPR